MAIYLEIKKELTDTYVIAIILSICDDKLGCFLYNRLGTKAYVSLLKLCDHKLAGYCGGTLLMAMSTSVFVVSDNLLLLIEEFFESLSTEEAARYLAETNQYEQSIIFVCTNMKLLSVIIKYIISYDQNGFNALMIECTRATISLERINFFLDHGMNINAKTLGDNYTALILCCAHFKPPNYFELLNDDHKNVEDAIKLLIFRGADTSITTKDNKTAFDHLRSKHIFSPQLLELLEGITRINRTKKAIQ